MIDRYSRPRMGRVWSEENKLEQWLTVEIAVCEAWAQRGVIPAEAIAKIRGAQYDREKWAAYEREMHHDFNAFVRAMADSLGEESRFVHLGLTSSDVLDTGLALQLIEATELLEEGVRALMEAVAERAREHKGTLTMGRSHGVHAEPTSFGLKLAGWYDEMRRNAHRLTHAKEQLGVGKISGPVGSHATVPQEVEDEVCGSLGLMVEPISTQVVQRDRHALFVSTLAIIAASLERFATEIRHLQRTEVREVEEPFSPGQTGSSSMPHKRNPEKCERICGLARLFRGYVVTALEDVALWHERDISHSSAERVILPDACILLDYMLDLFTYIVSGMRVNADRMRENLEAIILCTVTPDTYMPAGAVYIQRALAAQCAAAFDLSAACTGFIYGVAVGSSLIRSGVYRHVLVVGAETLSRFVDFTDRNTCILFGDGAGAAVLSRVEGESPSRIVDNYLRADGNGASLIEMPGGGSRMPPSHDTVEARQHFLRMEGKEVFKFATKSLVELIETALARNNLLPEDLALIIPHQVNYRIIEAALKKVAIPQDRMFLNLERYGNTSAASVPIAFHEAVSRGCLKRGEHVLLVAFGAGLTWGYNLLRW